MPTLALILLSLTAAFWLARVLSPSSRRAPRFRYNAASSPADLNRIVPRADLPNPNPPKDPHPWPAVTVIVPGRNEGHLLPTTLASLCAMDYPNFHVIFIDDASTDNTPSVSQTLQSQFDHLTVIRNTDAPPEGYVGKTFAVLQGLQAAEARGMTPQYFLFCDSDLHFHPQCLKQMVRLAHHRQLHLASLLPFCHCPTLGEKLGLMAALQLIALVFPLRKANDPKWPNKALVAGGFMLFDRQAYLDLGTHEAVRGHLIEDVALGTLAKQKGLRVFTVGTEDLLTGRMYEGLRDTFQGLRKNAFAATGFNPLATLIAVLALLLIAVLPPLYAAAAIAAWILHPSLLTFTLCALAVTAWSAMLHTFTRANNLLRFPWPYAWLSPLAVLFYLTVLAASIKDYYTGGPQWSGRRYHPSQTQSLNTSSQ